MRSPLLLCALVASSLAAPATHPGPQVTIKNGTVIGTSNNSVDSFLGIPYAQPPINELRLSCPQPLKKSFGTINLPNIPTACVNMNMTPVDTSGIPPAALPVMQSLTSNLTGSSGEDCLTINVQRPSNIPRGKKLPVLFWIYGGGWEIGTTQWYDATKMLNLSMTIDEPIIFVAANYRLNAFGFLQGKEMQAAGLTNLGLRDQRKALEWVAENIEAFGGDSDRVTIWGESAGAASVLDHLTVNNGDHTYQGKPLFRAAIMNSGTAVPTLQAGSEHTQQTFDAVASAAKCSSAVDKIDCLRKAPFDTFVSAMNSVPNFMTSHSNALSYVRRPDPSSTFYAQDGLTAMQTGHYAHVPMITFSLEDEATPFAVSQRDIINSTKTLTEYFESWFPTTPRHIVAELVNAYPNVPFAGLPANTNDKYELYPEYKRNAAIQTDITFSMWRRIVLSAISSQVPTWSGMGTYLNDLPQFGTYHTSDLALQFGIQGFAGKTLDEAYIRFVTKGDPNGGEKGQWWPRYGVEKRDMAVVGKDSVSVGRDDYRWAAYEVMKRYAGVLKQ